MTITISDGYQLITEDEARRFEDGAAWFAAHPHTWETAGTEDGVVFTTHTASPCEARAIADARAGFAAACERTVAGGHCTGCEKPAAELLPWSGERLCWDCVDTQMDLLAKAVMEDYAISVGTRGLR